MKHFYAYRNLEDRLIEFTDGLEDYFLANADAIMNNEVNFEYTETAIEEIAVSLGLGL